MFLSWGAEEYSLCGSREFVEQYEMELSERGVAYINTDVCMSGPILEPVASPTLMDLMVPMVLVPSLSSDPSTSPSRFSEEAPGLPLTYHYNLTSHLVSKQF